MALRKFLGNRMKAAQAATENSKVMGFNDLMLTLYHETNMDSVKKIEESQMMKAGSRGSLGPGIYFAESPEAASRKATRKGVTLKCLVKLSTICNMEKRRSGSISKKDIATLGCKSVVGVFNTGTEYVVYDPKQILAAWVVKGAPEKLLFPATATDHRPECRYGAKCNRRNFIHFKRFRHTSPINIPTVIPSNPATRPFCQKGCKCDIKDLSHFEKFRHPKGTVMPKFICPYGSRCWRKNYNHLKKYTHM